MTSPTFIHPTALCETKSIGSGTRVWAFAHVMEGARVGAECNICDYTFIESGVVIGDRVTVKNGVLVCDCVTVEDDVFLGPHVVFTNVLRPRAVFRPSKEEFLPTVVRRTATIGANATICCGVVIGEGAMIGAGSVVIRDVPPYALVVGNPSRRIGWSCSCGEKLGEDLVYECGRRFRFLSDGPGLEVDERPS